MEEFRPSLIGGLHEGGEQVHRGDHPDEATVFLEDRNTVPVSFAHDPRDFHERSFRRDRDDLPGHPIANKFRSRDLAGAIEDGGVRLEVFPKQNPLGFPMLVVGDGEIRKRQ